jgi:hypothetical protein
MKDLIKTYGRVTVLNLLKTRSDRELRLTKGYERQIYDAEPTYKPNYVPFDFAHFCSNDRYDSMKVMIDKTDEDLRKNGFFVEDLNTRTVL